MALIGSLAVNVVANVNKFTSGMTKVRKDLNGIGGPLNAATRSFKTFAAAGLGALGVGSLAVMTKNVLESVDALAKQAKMLDINIEKLQALKLGAKLSGVEETVLVNALKKLQLRGSEANKINKESAGILDDVAERLPTVTKLYEQYGERLNELYIIKEEGSVKDKYGRKLLQQEYDLAQEQFRYAEARYKQLTNAAQKAGTDTNEFVKIFRELNISLDDFATAKPDKQLGMLADALQKVPQHADKVRIAMKLFEEQGVGMLNMLKDGAPGLDQFAKDLAKAGGTVSEADAANVERFNDAFTKLKDTVGGFWRDFVIDVTPAAISIVSSLQDILNDLQRDRGNTIPGMVQQGIKSFMSGSKMAGEAYQKYLWQPFDPRTYRGLNLNVQRQIVLDRNRDRWEQEQLRALRSIDAGVHQNKPPVVLQGAGL
jgi:hypothetical protein